MQKMSFNDESEAIEFLNSLGYSTVTKYEEYSIYKQQPNTDHIAVWSKWNSY